jgi:ABC-type cobalamin/Fe3+-siderophores transport system ATPase subunit
LVDIRTNEKRKLQDLSDGEKALISIALASIYKNKKQKLLLLDEYDSVLNP